MKAFRSLLVVILLMPGGLPLLSATFIDQFQRSNRLYENGDFAGALAGYQEIARHRPNWKLFYNMGNCCYKLGRFVEAKIYYLQARKINPLEPGVVKNIGIVNRQFADAIPGEREDFLSRLFLRLETVLPLAALDILLLAFVFLFNACLFLLLIGRHSRFIIYLLSLFFLLTLICSLYHVQRVEKLQRQETAVVLPNEAELRSGPGANNTIIFKIHAGLEVRLIESHGEWCQVSASAQINGWLEKAKLRFI
jgi:tetratricopeptide (TPR) repeat protein